MLGMKKNTLCVLLSLLFAGAVSAQDAGTPPAAAEAHKRAIKAELSKPVALNVAGAAADLDPKPISQIAASTAGTASQVMRIWISPWRDSSDSLNWSGYVFTEVTPKRWSFGEQEVRHQGLPPSFFPR